MHSSLFVVAIVVPFTLAAPFTRLPGTFWPRQDNGTCNIADLPQPTSTLTPPTSDLSLVLIALGRGTQNYTCANATAAPAAFGALAQLFNASCAVANNALGSIQEDTASIGTHFFFDNTTPDFDIIGLGNTRAKKAQEADAPDPANVKWLRLEAQQDGTTSAVREIYRLNTIGGLAPATCEGQTDGSVVTVEYQAQYWVYASTTEISARREKNLGLLIS